MSKRAGKSRRLAKQEIRQKLSVLSVEAPCLPQEDEDLIVEMSRGGTSADGSCYDEGNVLPIDWGRRQFNRFCQSEASASQH